MNVNLARYLKRRKIPTFLCNDFSPNSWWIVEAESFFYRSLETDSGLAFHDAKRPQDCTWTQRLSMAEQWVLITFIRFITSISQLGAHSLFLRFCCWGVLLFLTPSLTLPKVFSFPLISQPPYPHLNYFREPRPYTVRDNSGVNLTQHGPVKQWQMLLFICATIYSLVDHWRAWMDLQMKDINVMQCRHC